MRAAYCAGVASHGSTAPRAVAPRRSARPGSVTRRSIAAASSVASPGSTSRPSTPSSTRSGIPPVRLPTTPRPRQKASITTRPSPSDREGSTSSRRSVQRRRDLGGGERGCPTHSVAELGYELFGDLDEGAAPDDVQVEVGHSRRDESPRLGEHVGRLVALEHSHEEHNGWVGQRLRLGLDERVQIHERGELGGRLHAEVPHQSGRVRPRSCGHRLRGGSRSAPGHRPARREAGAAASRTGALPRQDRRGRRRSASPGPRASLRPRSASALSWAP